MTPQQTIEARVQALQCEGLLRRRHRQSLLTSACSNDYLGLNGAPSEKPPSGAGGSRVVVGDHPLTRELEVRLANWTGYADALLFTSGYAANVGLLQAIAREGDLLVSDERNHASIIDGCRLSRADTVVVAHRDLGGFERALQRSCRGTKWVVTESYFSMDGTVAPVAALRRLTDEHNAGLIVDEAHALGVYGPTGAGRCEAEGIAADIVVGTIGKALASQGAFVASCASIIAYLWSSSRSFVYSTGISPQVSEAALRNLTLLLGSPGLRETLWQRVTLFRRLLSDQGTIVSRESEGPIVPVVVGDSYKAVAYENELLKHGYIVRAIRPPTVPVGTARLRIAISASMSQKYLEHLAQLLSQCALAIA